MNQVRRYFYIHHPKARGASVHSYTGPAWEKAGLVCPTVRGVAGPEKNRRRHDDYYYETAEEAQRDADALNRAVGKIQFTVQEAAHTAVHQRKEFRDERNAYAKARGAVAARQGRLTKAKMLKVHQQTAQPKQPAPPPAESGRQAEANYVVTTLLPKPIRPNDEFFNLGAAVVEAARRGDKYGVWSRTRGAWAIKPGKAEDAMKSAAQRERALRLEEQAQGEFADAEDADDWA